MSRSRRSFAWPLILALLCAFVAAAERPAAVRAAGPTFTVTTTSDAFSDPSETCTATPSNCTLRKALNAANLPGNAGSTIEFEIQRDDPGYTNFPTTGHDAWIITPTLALPPLQNDGTIVDGSTQTNRVGNDNNDGAEMIIDGTAITNTGGLSLQSNGNTVRGIGIVNFRGDGSPGSLKGVGIEISGDNNTIQGNYIGLGVAPTGTVAAPNIDAGIIIYGKNNLIGGDNTAVTTQFNVISGNSGDGILVNGGDTNNIAGNYIGTNGAISAAIPNGGNGINLRLGANGNIIGNYLSAAVVSYRNFISGNNGYGIQITNSPNNKIYGNFVGLNKSGTSKISNGRGGIRIDGTSTSSATGNIIGATAPGPQYMRNYIAGNGGPGIELNGFGARLNQIVANYVGIGSNNLVPGAAPQLSAGILLDAGASDNTVGGAISTLGQNVVAGISGDGIRVAGLTLPSIVRARGNTISGNYVGVGPTGTTALANSGAGIVLDTYVVSSTIGGATADLRNLIARNTGDGITIRGTNVTTTTIQKNTIQFNGGHGINIATATNTRVDGGDAAGANQITNNGGNGIQVTDSFTTTMRFNSGSSNAQNGVLISASRYTTLISNTLNSNTFNGLQVSGGRDTTVNTNTLNSNTKNGVQIDTVSLDTAITGSTIYSNTLKGVLVSDVGTQRVKILDNSMQGNGTGGIDLSPDTTGLPGVATNPNHDIDPPQPSSLHINQNGLLTGKVYVGDSAAACAGCTIQVFKTNPVTLDGQGRDKLPVSPAVADDGSFTANLGSIPAQLALTATDATGNTSEFVVFTRRFGLEIVPEYPIRLASPAEVLTYTHQLVNTGTVDFDNIQLSAVAEQPGWDAKIAPPSPVSVAAGQSKPITLTLTLPLGPGDNVLEGLIEHTTITASAITPNPATLTTAILTDTTQVRGAFVLQVIPPGLNGFGSPKAPNVDYSHTVTNVGNKAGTVTISATTDLGWTTSVTPTTITLQPGQSAGFIDRAVVPQGAQADTVAQTAVTFSGDDSAVITDTTTVLVDPRATIDPVEGEGAAKAGDPITFEHTVTNGSNGTTTFRLTGASSQGSQIRFIPVTPDITLNPDNSFTLNTSDHSSFTFKIEITVADRALKGDDDLVAINLFDENDAVVASARDTIHVTQSKVVPRQYLPLISS